MKAASGLTEVSTYTYTDCPVGKGCTKLGLTTLDDNCYIWYLYQGKSYSLSKKTVTQLEV